MVEIQSRDEQIFALKTKLSNMEKKVAPSEAVSLNSESAASDSDASVAEMWKQRASTFEKLVQIRDQEVADLTEKLTTQRIEKTDAPRTDASVNVSLSKELTRWKRTASELEATIAARDAEVEALTVTMRELAEATVSTSNSESILAAAESGKELAKWKAHAAELEATVAVRDKETHNLTAKLQSAEQSLEDALRASGTGASVETKRLQAVLDETIAENNELIDALKASNEHAAEMANHEHELEEELHESDEHLKEVTALNKSLFDQIQQLKAQLAATVSTV